MSVNISNLNSLIRDVAEKRRELAEAKATADLLREEMQQSPIIQEEAEKRAALAQAEDALRSAAVEEYSRTGNKKPGPGVGIRLYTDLHYDEGQALQWALDHRMALSLDKKTFEKIAKADTPEFVTISERPVATISSNLDEQHSGKQWLADKIEVSGRIEGVLE